MSKRKKPKNQDEQPEDLEQNQGQAEEEQIDPNEPSGISKESDEKKKTKKQAKLDDLEEEIRSNLTVAIKARADWTEMAKEDINFALGNQWTEAEKLDLQNQRRPCMAFNKIKPLIQLITGHLIQTKSRIQAFPEGGEDETFTAVCDKMMDHVEKVSHLNFKLSYQFSAGEKAGESWIEFYLDYDDDPIFGQLKIPNLGPFKVFVDPTSTEYDLSDAGFLFKVLKISKAKLKHKFPDKAKEIERNADDSLSKLVTNVQNVPSGDDSDYGNSSIVPRGGLNTTWGEELKGDQKECTVVEYWKKDYVDRWFVYFVADGATEEFDTEEEATAEISRRQKEEHARALKEQQAQHLAAIQQLAQHIVAGGPGPHPSAPPPPMEPPQPIPIESVKIEHAIKKRKVTRMKVAIKVGQVWLTDGLVDSPFEPHYSGFPQFRYIAEWAPESDKPELQIQGMVRSLKDPQREKNKARSQFLHILNTSANSGWIGDEDALTPAKWDELKDFGAVPGITIQKKKGSTLERIHPTEPSVANNVREKAANDDFKEVSGVNSDLLAMDASANPSGKAITLRIRQAITILQSSFENFRYTKIMIGQFLFAIIPIMFDASKMEKVVGAKFMQENKLTKGQLSAYLTMIKDGKFHVKISEAGAPDTLREETFEDLSQLLQHGMQLPPDLLMEFMNLPNKQEVINRVKEYAQIQMQMQMAVRSKKPVK